MPVPVLPELVTAGFDEAPTRKANSDVCSEPESVKVWPPAPRFDGTVNRYLTTPPPLAIAVPSLCPPGCTEMATGSFALKPEAVTVMACTVVRTGFACSGEPVASVAISVAPPPV